MTSIQDKVAHLVKLYTPTLVPLWQIKVVFVDKLMMTDTEEGDAVCDWDVDYMNATITFSVERLSQMSDGEVRETVVHELTHPLLAEEGLRNHRRVERIATRVARAILAAQAYS